MGSLMYLLVIEMAYLLEWQFCTYSNYNRHILNFMGPFSVTSLVLAELQMKFGVWHED